MTFAIAVKNEGCFDSAGCRGTVCAPSKAAAMVLAQQMYGRHNIESLRKTGRVNYLQDKWDDKQADNDRRRWKTEQQRLGAKIASMAAKAGREKRRAEREGDKLC